MTTTALIGQRGQTFQKQSIPRPPRGDDASNSIRSPKCWIGCYQVTKLPDTLKTPLQEHLKQVKVIHEVHETILQRSVKEVVRKDVSTTMIYIHVLNKGEAMGSAVLSMNCRPFYPDCIIIVSLNIDKI